MKRIILSFIFTFTAGLLLAQVPQAFKYQAVIRDKAGQVLSNQEVTLQITILQSHMNGPEVYREIHSVATSELGLVNVEVGHGKALTGSLPAIDWSTGSHFLRVEMDQAGGTDLELMGISQLLSVPYALYAEKSGSGTRDADLDWEIIGNDVVTGHGGSYPIGNVGIGNNAPGSLLYVAKNMGEPMITIRNLGGGGGATYSMVDDLSGANWKFKATTYGGFKIRDQANSLDVLTMEPNSAANSLYIKSGGNVGIGTSNPDNSALVELSSTSRGFLLPRIALTAISSKDPITNPAVGLLVYNTETAGIPPNNVIPGYYGWNGSKWISVAAPPGIQTGEMLYWDGVQWISLSPGPEGKTLTICDGVPIWGSCPNIPLVSTSDVAKISLSSALIGGTADMEGELEITERGVYWSVQTNPEITGVKIAIGEGTGSFSHHLTGLAPGTSYYVKAFAMSDSGISFGSNRKFTTLTDLVLDKISGYVQKGPFINGTSIVMFELDPIDLHQTGESYTTQIKNNRGLFEIDNLLLSSNFVEFSANGYYYNEVNGSISPSMLNLFTISDISDLSQINVNILTHLEKSRIEYLFEHDSSFIIAKKQAQQEILAIFGMEDIEIDDSETLDISVDGEGNAILIAISVILQGNRTVGALTELMANIITDIRPDGILDDQGILASLRNSTLALDLNQIRYNLVSRYQYLGVSATIPDFETYVNLFLASTGTEPSAVTSSATNITTSTALLNGLVDPGSDSTTVIFEYGNTPELGLSTTAEQNPVIGSTQIPVFATITGLDPGTTYYFRITAENGYGSSIGEISIFNTTITSFSGTVQDFDGNIYQTIGIGYQEWMAENLKTTHYQNGVAINSTWNSPEGSYCWYNNNIDYKNAYGALYNWFAATNENGLCPEGWRVPFDSDWSQLVSYLVDNYNITNNNNDPNGVGNNLKSCLQAVGSPVGEECNSLEHPRWEPNVTHHGNDNFGFSGLPGGYRTGEFSYVGMSAGWLSTTISNNSYIWSRMLYYDDGSITRDQNFNNTFGLSVRCLKIDQGSGGTSDISTEDVSVITSNSAESGGDITSDIGINVIARGVVWSTGQNPTIYLNQGITQDGSGSGTFTSSLTGLSPFTTYYVRAYASDTSITMYGNQVSFTTLPEIDYGAGVTDVDGNSYVTVIIGDQEWMAENLKTTLYRDSTPIGTTWYIDQDAYCWYMDNSNYKNAYGGLYNWFAATNSHGLCPQGWRVPFDSDWEQLIHYLMVEYGYTNDDDDANGVGNKLKSCRQAGTSPLGGDCSVSEHPRWEPHDIHYGSDFFGFSGLPGGFRQGEFYNLGMSAGWLSTTISNNSYIWSRMLNYDQGSMTRDQGFNNNFGLSVRCIKE
ncbi:MAG TPA: FISUMP domain-containing protein [Bacteroidales bacterium]|nr:FISUMP domain-containing protein [Bacteroidales bacterium]